MPGITHEVEYVGGPAEMTRGTWLWIGAGVLAVVLVMFMQWFQVDTRSQTTTTAPLSARQSEAVEWGAYSPFALEAKEAIKMGQAKHGRNADREEDGEPVTIKDKFHEKIEPLAVTRAERLRLAIVAGEIFGKDEALTRLAALGSEMEPGSPLAADIEWLRRIYADGAESVPPDAQQALLDRHDWFGQLALSFGKPMSNTYRRHALEGWKQIELAYFRIGGLYLLMFFGGIGLLIWGGILIGGRTIAFDNAPGGNHDEYLQTFVLFCGAFVIVGGLSLVPFGMAVEGSIGAQVFHDILSWILPLVLIWPLSRGVKWSRFREDVGWTTGRGVIKEVAIGAMAQIAWTPLLLLLALFLGLIGGLLSSGEKGVSGYPMFQHPPIEHPVVLFINITSLVIWAPLVEETIFRGLQYGWIRQRLGFRGTLLITSAIFGMIHPYSPLGMVQVAFGGLLFGMLREWRGSLIAPMVAHAINNGVIAIVSLTIARAIGG